MIWLIGNKGMLGTELSQVFSARSLAFIGTDRECDITDISALRTRASGKDIRWMVNCSAYTAVDRAEDEESLARKINAEGAGNIATVAQELGARLVHISTDYVFAGDGTRPYLEEDPIAPAGAYGRTKAEGESLVRSACKRNFIIRTAWLYGRYGKNFVYTMLRLMAERDEVGVVSDQRGSPTWAKDLASAIAQIVLMESQEFGTYHFANEGECSWYDFALEIYKLGREAGILSKDTTVKALTSDQFPSKVKRPSYSVLSKKKIALTLGISPPSWQASLKECIADLAKNGISLP